MSPTRVICALLFIAVCVCIAPTSVTATRHYASSYPNHIPSVRPPTELRHDNVRTDITTDCAIKELMLEYALSLQGSYQPNVQSSVHDALELEKQCGIQLEKKKEEREYMTFFPTHEKRKKNANLEKVQQQYASHSSIEESADDIDAIDSVTYYVDGTNGSDENNGTISSPFATFPHAIRIMRYARSLMSLTDLSLQPVTIVLRQGIYYFPRALTLSTMDSYLTITSYQQEEVVFSGGVDLSELAFQSWTAGGNSNILVAAIPTNMSIKLDSNSFNEIYINGRRSVRARYPNGNAETMGLWAVNNTGYIGRSNLAWISGPQYFPATEVHILTPFRIVPKFTNYQIGIDGPASVFDPPSSFWCTANPPAGVTYTVPSGVTYPAGIIANETYSDASSGYLHTFHSDYWGGWVFSVASINSSTILFSGGGHQEARGTPSGGAEWYLENLLEELDEENEWWLDEVNGLLYFYPNQSQGTMIPGPNGFYYFNTNNGTNTFIGTQSPTILNVHGTSSAEEDLVTNFIVTGITFAHTSSTFMQPMEVPSGGDWSITRIGGVQIENTRNVTVLECLFTGHGGNALVVNRANYNTSIIANEFVWIGSSAVLVAGQLDGIDGSTQRTYPVGTFIHANLFHELGIWVKQSSAVGVVLAQASTVDSNICFNLARACVNYNDGFGGSHQISNNLLFNSVRETDDHGPFNSWDRQVYLQRTIAGIASLIPDQNYITRNLMYGNYHSVWPIDHDDGSEWYTDTQNYLVYGGYKSYLGNSVNVWNNIYVLPDGKVQLPPLMTTKEKKSRKGKRSQEAVLDESHYPNGLSTILRHRAYNMGKKYNSGRKMAHENALRELGQDMEDDDDETTDAHFKHHMVGAPWGVMCAEDGGGFGHVWTNNTCAFLNSTDLYNFWACNPKEMKNTIPVTGNNKFYVAGAINVSCASAITYTFAQWQTIGNDEGSVQLPPATLSQLIQWGEELFGLGEYAEKNEEEVEEVVKVDVKHRVKKGKKRQQQHQQQHAKKKQQKKETAYTRFF